MFRKPFYLMFLGNLATVIAQLSYDGPAYEYPDYTSGPTVQCTSTRTQISMITQGPDISQTLEACATLKDDAEYSDHAYKCASGDTCMSSYGWWGCCAQANGDTSSYDCPVVTSCVEHKYLSDCGQSCSEETYVTRCTDPEKPYCITATAVQNLADIRLGPMSFRTLPLTTGTPSSPFDATCWAAKTTVSVIESYTVTLGTASERPIGLHIACGGTQYNGLQFTISTASARGNDGSESVSAAARPDGVDPAILMDTAAFDFSGTAPSGVAINPVTFTGSSCGLEQNCASSTRAAQAAEPSFNVVDIGIGTPQAVGGSVDSSSTDALRSAGAGSEQEASDTSTHSFADLFAGIVARATTDGSTLSFPTATQSGVVSSSTTSSGARKVVSLSLRGLRSVGLGVLWTAVLFLV